MSFDGGGQCGRGPQLVGDWAASRRRKQEKAIKVVAGFLFLGMHHQFQCC